MFVGQRASSGWRRRSTPTPTWRSCTRTGPGVHEDGSRNEDRFNEANGWVYGDVEVDGRTHLRCHAMTASPHDMGLIWYEPNHLRAFRGSAYGEVGGYDASLEVLDDQELMVRLYQAGDFVHVPECLYLQRVHASNTQVKPRTNAFIQAQTVAYYQHHIGALARAWCRRSGLAEIGLRVPGSIPVEPTHSATAVDFDPDKPQLPYDDGSVGALWAVEVLQHVADRAAFFNECYRVLAHGGLIFTETPSTDGRGAFQDPSLVSLWNENSFWYVTQSALRPSLPRLTARFQVSHQRTFYPTQWHEQVHIAYVQANLIAVKTGPRNGGPLLC